MICTKCGNIIQDQFDACGTCGQSYMTCPKCSGRGEHPSMVAGWGIRDICSTCKGAKKIRSN